MYTTRVKYLATLKNIYFFILKYYFKWNKLGPAKSYLLYLVKVFLI